MLILALDTTTRTSSCAVARDGAVLREQAGNASTPQAERLPGDLIALLEHERLALAEIDAFAVATGPGSFTGLRIGIATMQGLAFATGKPLIGVSGFDALAHVIVRLRPEATGDEPRPEATPARLATWVDAWRGEIYAALYENGHEVEPPLVARPEDVLDALRRRLSESESRVPIVFAGDGAGTYRDLILRILGDQARIADPASPWLAGAVAQLAGARPGLHPPHAIRPLYVRRPDAELAREHRVR
ncbi:MAG TPA: tRNA (adenosine(37)-N6)-threonylcarbamoyltransferase complex dimerization subunit type 1 TsaB [Vicinamibacterales bacterium]